MTEHDRNSRNLPTTSGAAQPLMLSPLSSPDKIAIDHLQGWTIHDPLPAALSLTALMHAISSAEQRLVPASQMELAVAVGRIVEMATTFRVDCDPTKVAEAYQQMCAGMPGDLLSYGIDLVLSANTDTFRVPMPGHVWKAIMPEYNRRKGALDRLKTAKMIGDRRGYATTPGPEPDFMPKKDLDALMADVRAALGDATLKFKKQKRPL